MSYNGILFQLFVVEFFFSSFCMGQWSFFCILIDKGDCFFTFFLKIGGNTRNYMLSQGVWFWDVRLQPKSVKKACLLNRTWKKSRLYKVFMCWVRTCVNEETCSKFSCETLFHFGAIHLKKGMEKMKSFSFMERISIFYGRDMNIEILSLKKIKISNKSLAFTYEILYYFTIIF